ncbi:MAG: hypothetical protein KAJ42_14405 [Gemmatimonadetes bacterium]|nr:hypothetical protein [Gemmatimonadota bacterium]
MNPQATAGRIVHYYDNTTARAAIHCLDADEDGTAPELHVFGMYGLVRGVPYAEDPKPGCWSWMPYQKQKAGTPGGNVSESAEPRPD